MNSFLTGSQAYGTPREDSDIDLVVMMSSATMDQIAKILGPDANNESAIKYDDSSATACFRFGQLNLLAVANPDDYWVWREGTDELVFRKPVTRDEAVALFKAKREAAKEARGDGAETVVLEIEEEAS